MINFAFRYLFINLFSNLALLLWIIWCFFLFTVVSWLKNLLFSYCLNSVYTFSYSLFHKLIVYDVFFCRPFNDKKRDKKWIKFCLKTKEHLMLINSLAKLNYQLSAHIIYKYMIWIFQVVINALLKPQKLALWFSFFFFLFQFVIKLDELFHFSILLFLLSIVQSHLFFVEQRKS